MRPKEAGSWTEAAAWGSSVLTPETGHHPAEQTTLGAGMGTHPCVGPRRPSPAVPLVWSGQLGHVIRAPFPPLPQHCSRPPILSGSTLDARDARVKRPQPPALSAPRGTQ